MGDLMKVSFKDAFLDGLNKVKKVLENFEFSRATSLVEDLISAANVMKAKHALLIAEFLHSIFSELEDIEDMFFRRPISVRRISTISRLRLERLIEEMRVSKEESEVEKDVKSFLEEFSELLETIRQFMSDPASDQTKASLLDKMADFRFHANKLLEKYGG